jgi:hypothetical protein
MQAGSDIHVNKKKNNKQQNFNFLKTYHHNTASFKHEAPHTHEKLRAL